MGLMVNRLSMGPIEKRILDLETYMRSLETYIKDIHQMVLMMRVDKALEPYGKTAESLIEAWKNAPADRRVMVSYFMTGDESVLSEDISKEERERLRIALAQLTALDGEKSK
jgi:hypothetical protein